MWQSFKRAPMQWLLVAWTLLVWGSRLRNIAADDELSGTDRLLAFGVAGLFVVGAVLVVVSFAAGWSTHPHLLLALVIGGIARWSVRGPIILASDQWSFGFKLVHTVLWLLTVAISLAAWRELRRRR